MIRYVGLALPVLVLAVTLAAVLITSRNRRGLVVLAGVLGLGALGTYSKVADQVGYRLPWRDPYWIHVGGRDYYQPTGCMTKRVVTKYAALYPVGWVYGYLAVSRRLYANEPTTHGRTPTVLYMEGGTSVCFIAYSLSGGP